MTEYKNGWRRRNPLAHQRASRRQSLRRRYGLTVMQWESIFSAQDHRCACCGSTTTSHSKGWCVDHDHTTGIVRGIVCQRCNSRLGAMGDDEAGVRRVVAQLLAYLSRTALEHVPNPTSERTQSIADERFDRLAKNPAQTELSLAAARADCDGRLEFHALLDRSSIGAGLRDIRERGLAAHLADLEREMRPRRRR